MALIDRIKYDPTGDAELVHRWSDRRGEPKDDLVLGSQVIVNAAQEAVFVKGGKVLDILPPGTHTLSSANLPLLGALVNLPFGGKTPFTAELYFVNRRAKLDMKWGTTSPIVLVDPQYGIPVPVQAYGQFGIAVSDSRTFVTSLVGTARSFGAGEVSQYFGGLLEKCVKDLIAKQVVRSKTPILELPASLTELSESVLEGLTAEFARFGLEVLNFFIRSIGFPDDDPAVARLREALATRAELLQLGDGYRVKRTFDVLEQAAGNSGGIAGTFLAGGLGLGMGVGAGPAFGRSLAAEMGVEGSVAGGAGQAAGGRRRCAACGEAINATARFCSACGQAAESEGRHCTKCGVAASPDSHFCASCGTALG